jgi:hypothetical protein
MDLTINKNDKHKNTKELFVVDRNELISKLNDIIQLEQKNKVVESDTNNKKKVRRNKKKFYVEERNLLISKLDNLLNIEKNNYAIVYDDLVENTELINFLNDNAEYIKKIYSASAWVYYNPQHVKKNEITLMKSIYKDHGYKFASSSKTILRDNGIKKKCTILHFLK